MQRVQLEQLVQSLQSVMLEQFLLPLESVGMVAVAGGGWMDWYAAGRGVLVGFREARRRGREGDVYMCVRTASRFTRLPPWRALQELRLA